MSRIPDSPVKSFLLLLFLSSTIYLVALGTAGIHRAQEARVAQVSREMRATGEWVVPHLNGRVRLNKPPIPYWAVAGSYAAMGGVTELAARLPSALAAIAGVLLTAALGARLYGPRPGLLAGVVLATTQLYIAQGRRAEADVPMTLFVILSMYGFERGFREGRPRWKLLFFAAMGLGFMTKGVPGLALPLLAALIWLFWEGRIRESVRPSFIAGVVLVLLVIAPWYATIWFGFPESVEVFRAETLARLAEDAPHAEPFYYYFLRTPLHLLPWVLLLPVIWSRLREEPGARSASRLPLAWFAGGLLFLTLLKGKQPHYLVPLLPSAAILAGGGLDRALAAASPRWLTGRAVALFAGVAALAAIAFVAIIEPGAFADKSPREVCGHVTREVGRAPLVLYQFDNSPCIFYLDRIVPVAEDAAGLRDLIDTHPDAYVLARERDAGGSELAGHPVLWKSENYKRDLVLLGPLR